MTSGTTKRVTVPVTVIVIIWRFIIWGSTCRTTRRPGPSPKCDCGRRLLLFRGSRSPGLGLIAGLIISLLRLRMVSANISFPRFRWFVPARRLTLAMFLFTVLGNLLIMLLLLLLVARIFLNVRDPCGPSAELAQACHLAKECPAFRVISPTRCASSRSYGNTWNHGSGRIHPYFNQCSAVIWAKSRTRRWSTG